MSDMTSLIEIYHKETNPIKKGIALFFIGVSCLLALAAIGVIGFIGWLLWAASTGNLPS